MVEHVSASAWKISVNGAIEGVEMLFSPRGLKSQNSIERTQPRIVCATFNDNLCTTIVSCYSPSIPVMKRISQPSTTSYLTLLNAFPNTTFYYRWRHECSKRQ